MNQCNQEVRDGFSTERNPVKDCILDEGTKFGLCSRYDCCSGTLRFPFGFRPGSWFLLASPGAWFPVFVFARGCCSESEDSLNLLRIQHSKSLCEYVSFFFLELRVHHCAVHSVHNSLLLHLANRASFTCKTDSFSWGHGPDALACKARPSSDKCGTSLSVSLSLSLSLHKEDATGVEKMFGRPLADRLGVRQFTWQGHFFRKTDAWGEK